MKTIYVTSTLEETYAAVKGQEKWTLKTVLAFNRIRVQLLFYNFVLKTLNKLWFKQKNINKDEVKNIVVYGVGLLGDNIIRLHAIQSLKNSFPDAKLIVIMKHQEWSKKTPEELFKCTDFISETYFVENNPVQRKGYHFSYDDTLLPKIKCDLFVNFSNFDNRGWFGAVLREMILAKKLGAKFAVGFKMKNVLNASNIITVRHRLVSNFSRLAEEVLQELDIDVDYSSNVFLHDEESEMKIDELLKASNIKQPFAVIHPGAKLTCKMWPAERFAELAKYLEKKYAIKSIITGVSSESYITQKLVALSDGSALDFAGKTTLSETIELVRKAAIVISNDTGNMHLASVMNIPTIGIYSTRHSPTDWFSLGDKFRAIFSFSATSLRYTDEEDISDLLQISVSDVCMAVDDMIQEYDLSEQR